MLLIWLLFVLLLKGILSQIEFSSISKTFLPYFLTIVEMPLFVSSDKLKYLKILFNLGLTGFLTPSKKSFLDKFLGIPPFDSIWI